jgi:hypothetical protein
MLANVQAVSGTGSRAELPRGLARNSTLQCSNCGRREENRGVCPRHKRDQLAAEAMEYWVDFQQGLSSDKRKYPIRQFKAFWAVTKRYAELTRLDPPDGESDEAVAPATGTHFSCAAPGWESLIRWSFE